VITFVRHGQTAVNRDGRLQGRLDARLSDVGRAQASALASALKDDAVSRVISSPLLRARETATAIADAQGLEVETDERLIELDYGEWDGVPLHLVPADNWAAWRADATFTPPGGESLVDVQDRVAAFCGDFVNDSDTATVAVSHVSPIKAAVCVALATGPALTWRMQLSLASITRIGGRADGTPYLLTYNEVAHLTSIPRTA
jgi:probable phosphoglycerate mutase